LIVLVSGAPGSGKTTLARQLAPLLRLPLISKDDIKETLFDTLGWSDREWSKTLGAGTWEVLWTLLGRAAESGSSLIVESNFHTEHRDRVEALGADVIEVHCSARPETIVRRFRERERHPGHVDAAIVIDDAQAILHAHQPITERVIHVDTEDPDAIDVDGIVRQIREAGL
jgi:predicted kinase